MSEPDRTAEENPDFHEARIAAFESRQAGEMARLIERFHGQPLVSPSIREVAIDPNPAAIDFAHRLITGQVDLVIFLTGVGFRKLLEIVERTVDRQRYLDALADVVTVARGPKPVAAMKEVGLTPTVRVPEPNTWRELLTTLDAGTPIVNQTVAIQEYGKPNPSLIAGLEARGASVISVPVYRWELPEDILPLLTNLHEIVSGRVDAVMFTSAVQVFNLLECAERDQAVDALRKQFGRMLVVSVGPTTSDALRDFGIRVDVEPEHPKMGSMVMAAARRISQLRRAAAPRIGVGNVFSIDLAGGREKDRHSQAEAETSASARSGANPGANPGATAGASSRPSATDETRPPWYDSLFMRACRREPNRVTPVWLMRQAGRYMAEYRAVRAKFSFLELCKNPALCSEVMITAVQRLGVDAAIIFSDLLPILEPLGFQLEFAAGDGPVIHNPIHEASDLRRVHELHDLGALDFVMETVRQTRRELPAGLPLIGFSGAPFTLASYAIEGGGSRNYLKTKQLMHNDPGAWNALMGLLSRAVVLYLRGQINAGAQCVQLFDSWVGCLGPGDYRRFVQPHMRTILSGLPRDVPVINFATGNPCLLACQSESDDGQAVIGIDWRIELDDAWNLLGHHRAIQGNLDPAVLLSSRDTIRQRVGEILRQAGGRPGHIFNLGHGILPSTNVDHAIAAVDAVHEWRQTG
ncbi:MAG: uroporphyrinogen decarboxylase [Planctomycetes bacterium]|nr:uroporphyrinogen decarboxylase [Planctomycetota bacterium]